MRYALFVSYGEKAEISPAEQSRRAAGFASMPARLHAAGAFTGVLRLQSASTGVTVRCWDGGDVLVSPGPAATAGEQLAACVLADCADTDAAIEVATSIPAAWYGSVEVRPLVVEPDQPDVAVPPAPRTADLAAAASPAVS